MNQSGNQVAYARHLRRDPLAGVPSKSVLILFGKGDQQVANPNATAMLRAGDLADRATYYRNDLALDLGLAQNPPVPVPKNPHEFVNRIADGVKLVAAIAREAQRQIALFLASDDRHRRRRHTEVVLPQPDPDVADLAGLFEVPIALPLPEGLNFIP